MEGDRITHTDDEFGLSDAGPELYRLGWIGATQILRQDRTLIAIDYAKHAVRVYTIPQDKSLGASEPVPVITEDKIVWVSTAEHPQQGLSQPTFDGTLMVSDVTLTEPRPFAVYTGVSAQWPPEFQIVAGSGGLVALTGVPATDADSAVVRVYDVRGNGEAKRVPFAQPTETTYVDGLFSARAFRGGGGIRHRHRNRGDRARLPGARAGRWRVQSDRFRGRPHQLRLPGQHRQLCAARHDRRRRAGRDQSGEGWRRGSALSWRVSLQGRGSGVRRRFPYGR